MNGEPKSDGEIHTRPREFEQTFASQLCDKMNQLRIILKTNVRQKMQSVLVVFSTGKVQLHKLFILLFIQSEICHSFQNLSVFTGWDIRVNQLFFKKWRRKVPGGAAGLQNQSGLFSIIHRKRKLTSNSPSVFAF